MSIRWIRNLLLDGEAATLEVLLGDREISDKCYYRINSGNEYWYVSKGETREEILNQGIQLLKKHFKGKNLTYPDGRAFDWK